MLSPVSFEFLSPSPVQSSDRSLALSLPLSPPMSLSLSLSRRADEVGRGADSRSGQQRRKGSCLPLEIARTPYLNPGFLSKSGECVAMLIQIPGFGHVSDGNFIQERDQTRSCLVQTLQPPHVNRVFQRSRVVHVP
jgi:hypothetical protein